MDPRCEKRSLVPRGERKETKEPEERNARVSRCDDGGEKGGSLNSRREDGGLDPRCEKERVESRSLRDGDGGRRERPEESFLTVDILDC